MNVGSAGSSVQAAMWAGGASLLKAASRGETEMQERMLPIEAAQSAGRAESEVRGMFVDTYA
jgi:hypothetical protein